MNSGNNDTISAKQILTMAKSSAYLDIKTSDQDAVLLNLVEFGINLLGVPSLFCKRQETIKWCDGKAKLPCGTKDIIALYPKCGEQFFPFVYINEVHFKDAGINLNTNNFWRPFLHTYQIENGFLWNHCFNRHYEDNTIQNDDCQTNSNHNDNYFYEEEAEIYFTGANLGGDGLPIVYKDYEFPLVNFVAATYGLGKMPQAASWDKVWRSTRLHLKGTERAEEFRLNKLEIVNLWQAMVVMRTPFKW